MCASISLHGLAQLDCFFTIRLDYVLIHLCIYLNFMSIINDCSLIWLPIRLFQKVWSAKIIQICTIFMIFSFAISDRTSVHCAPKSNRQGSQIWFYLCVYLAALKVLLDAQLGQAVLTVSSIMLLVHVADRHCSHAHRSAASGFGQCKPSGVSVRSEQWH